MNIKSKSELYTRTLSALVLAPLALFIVYLGDLYFTTLVMMAACMMAMEWSKIIGLDDPKNEHTMNKVIWCVLGLIYIITPSLSLIYIRTTDNGFTVLMWLLLSIWATDVGAYFVGINIKGPKICARISPKKTWSGLLGGIICATTVGYIFKNYNPHYHINFFHMSAALAVVSQMGDFLESSVKRKFNVKDSGSIIPGHGGILDRVDGLVTASIFIAVIEIIA